MALPLALVWPLIARDEASPAFNRVAASADRTAAATERATLATEGAGKRMVAALGALAKGSALVGAAVSVASLKMAGDFEFQMNRMVTAAGESRKNLKLVSDGVLNLMVSTGTSAKNLEQGLYLIESAGFHGKAGLDVLAVAAKGAKIENAGLAEVANAVTSAMVDYHLKAADSAAVMNTLIAGVAHGKTTLAELSTAFSNVGAAGAAAHVPMADLTAALATMTMHGTDAAKAGTYLRQTIGQLEAPSARARDMMKSLGLNANTVGLTLSSGPGGLSRAIQMLDDAITRHLTPSGLVALEAFKKSKGGITDYQKVLANLPPSMVTTFGALAQMTGGVKSLQGFLQLGGENLKTFRSNTLAINDAVKAGGKNVEGWASTQKQFNVVLDQVRGQLDKWLIQLGEKLIPLVEKLIGWIRGNAGAFKEIGQVIASIVMTAFHDLVVVVHGLVSLFKEHRKVIEDTARVIRSVFVASLHGLQDAFRATADWIGKHKTLVESLAVAVLAGAAAFALWKGAILVWTAVTKIAAAVQAAFNLVMDANPVLLVITAIAALAAGLVYAYKHSATFRDIVKDTWQTVKDVIHGAWVHVIKPVFDALASAWSATWNAVKAVWHAVEPVIAVIGKIFYAIIGGTVLGVLKLLQVTWEFLWGRTKLFWDKIGKPVIDAIGVAVSWLWKNIVKPTLGFIADRWNTLWGNVSKAWNAVGKPVFTAIGTAVGWVWKHVLEPTFGYISDRWSKMWSGMGKAFSSIWGGIKSAITTAINGIISIINGFISGIDWILSKLPGGLKISQIPHVGGSAPAQGKLGTFGGSKAFALGGVLPGYSPGIDNIAIPAHLFSGGEGILVPEATRALGGAKGIQSINSAYSNRVSSPGHFAGGGTITDPAVLAEALKMAHGLQHSGPLGAVLAAIGKVLRGIANGALTAAEYPVKAAIGLLPAGFLRSVIGGSFNMVDHGLRSVINGRQFGGPVSAGMPYVVGEKRPELFVPTTNGYIVPKVPSSHQTVTVNQTINTIIPVSPGISGPAGMRKAAAAFR